MILAHLLVREYILRGRGAIIPPELLAFPKVMLKETWEQ